MVERIPDFRAHIASSKQHNEVIMSAQMKYPDSPYPEIETAYSWHDFVPVAVAPFRSPFAFLGKRIKDILLLSRMHYKAPVTEELLRAWDARERYLQRIFGDPDSRRVENRIFGPWAAIASTASNLQLFWSEYDHFIVEDAGTDQIRIGKMLDPRQASKMSELQPFVILSLNSDEEILWRSILQLDNAA